jgi:hypothetical protein
MGGRGAGHNALGTPPRRFPAVHLLLSARPSPPPRDPPAPPARTATMSAGHPLQRQASRGRSHPAPTGARARRPAGAARAAPHAPHSAAAAGKAPAPAPPAAATRRGSLLLGAAAALAAAGWPRSAWAAAAAKIGALAPAAGRAPLPWTRRLCRPSSGPALTPPLSPLPPPAPVTVRPELRPDQSTYDPADPELRAAAALLQEALNAESVQREEALWTEIIDRWGPRGGPGWQPGPGGGPCGGREACGSEGAALLGGGWGRPLHAAHAAAVSCVAPSRASHPSSPPRYGGLDKPWVPDVVGRAWGNRGNARARQVGRGGAWSRVSDAGGGSGGGTAPRSLRSGADPHSANPPAAPPLAPARAALTRRCLTTTRPYRCAPGRSTPCSTAASRSRRWGASRVRRRRPRPALALGGPRCRCGC